MSEPVRLLVVCLGNICRSPMAEGALRHRIAEQGLEGRIEVDSAGTGDWHVGQPPDPRAVATAARHGVDIGHLRARQLQPRDFMRFDWLLCADRSNLRCVQALAPAAAQARRDLLLPWAGIAEEGEVPDPYTGAEPEFERAWALVDAAARGALARLHRLWARD